MSAGKPEKEEEATVAEGGRRDPVGLMSSGLSPRVHVCALAGGVPGVARGGAHGWGWRLRTRVATPRESIVGDKGMLRTCFARVASFFFVPGGPAEVSLG